MGKSMDSDEKMKTRALREVSLSRKVRQMIFSAWAKFTRGPNEIKCVTVPQLEKIEDLVADGDIIAGDCYGEISDTAAKSIDTTECFISEEETLTKAGGSVRMRRAALSSRAEKCLSWAGELRPERPADFNICKIQQWGSRKGGMI